MAKNILCFGISLMAFLAAGATDAAAPARPSITGLWTLDQADFEKHDTPPYTPEAAKIAAAAKAAVNAGKVINDDQRKCLPNGAPSMMLGEFALEVLETPGRVTLVSESSPLVRTVYLNRTKMSEGLEPMWNGYSLGKWEGGTLVVNTSNFNDKTPPIGFGGMVHTSGTAMTERFDLSPDGKVMTITTTQTDPRMLAKPFTIVRHYTRQPDDAELWEYACEIGTSGWSERYPGEASGTPPK